MSADRQLAYYHACGACSAKWFSPAPMEKCPVCASSDVLREAKPRRTPWQQSHPPTITAQQTWRAKEEEFLHTGQPLSEENA